MDEASSVEAHPSEPNRIDVADEAQALLAMLSPTTRCNMACRYCYVPRDEDPRHTDMSMSDICLAYQWLSKYRTLIGTRKLEIEWFGGEPMLLGADFLESAISCQEKFFDSDVHVLNRMQTNFTLVDSDFVALIKRRFGGQVSGSYDFGGGCRVFCDGHSAARKIEEKIDYLLSEGIKLGVVCTLTQDNVAKISEIYRFFRDRRIDFRVNRAAHVQNPAVGVLSMREYVAAVKKLLALYLSEEDPPMSFANFTTMVQAYLSGYMSFCVDAQHPEFHLAFEAEGRLFSRCRFFPMVANYLCESPEAVLAKLREVAGKKKKIPQMCADCRFMGKTCVGPCLGEQEVDCLHSDCGYRGETSFELWEFVEEFLSGNGYKWNQLGRRE